MGGAAAAGGHASYLHPATSYLHACIMYNQSTFALKTQVPDTGKMAVITDSCVLTVPDHGLVHTLENAVASLAVC